MLAAMWDDHVQWAVCSSSSWRPTQEVNDMKIPDSRHSEDNGQKPLGQSEADIYQATRGVWQCANQVCGSLIGEFSQFQYDDHVMSGCRNNGLKPITDLEHSMLSATWRNFQNLIFRWPPWQKTEAVITCHKCMLRATVFRRINMLGTEAEIKP